MGFLIVYLIGYAFSIYLFKQVNKGAVYYDRIPFAAALIISTFSWVMVILILWIGWYNQSSLKTKVDDFIEEFEEGRK